MTSDEIGVGSESPCCDDSEHMKRCNQCIGLEQQINQVHPNIQLHP